MVQHTDPSAVWQREVAAPSLSDAQRLLDALRGDSLYTAFVVALYTGLRAGEQAGLRVEDIDLTAGTARIHEQVQREPGRGLAVKPLKTEASPAYLDLIPEATAVLADAIGNQTTGYV